MAENKEQSHADNLFEILNEYRDKPVEHDSNMPKEAEADASSDIEQNGGGIDDALDIIADKNQNGDSGDLFEEGAIPVSIFGHLSEEANGERVSVAPPEGENPHFSNHFSQDDGNTPPLPEEERSAEADGGEDENNEKTSVFQKILNAFSSISFVPKAVIYILVVLVVSAYLSYYVITIGNDVFALVTDEKQVVLTIEEGATDKDVAKLLEENGVIEYGWVFKIYMKYHNSDEEEASAYIAGEHTLNTDYNYSQIINALTSNTVKREIVRITIPEGFTVDQIIDLLISNGVGQRENYIEAINNYPYKWEFVQLLDEMGYSENRKYRLEGYLYPDTYEFYTTESEVYVVNKMLNAFSDKFWKDFTRKNSDGESYQAQMLEKYGMNFDDVVVLASMVQSEGGNADDFYPISYVFHNRLDNWDNPLLESDATIQYALPERISDSEQLDVNYETPYNTYLYKGLPPGAISNPGLDALSAALFPAAPQSDSGRDIDAYYFVSNDAGKTYFASTLSGHNKNVTQAKADNAAIEAGTYEG